MRYPWRYRCPKCGSTSIYRNTTAGLPDMTHAHHGRRIANIGHSRGIAYYVRRWKCKVCGDVFDSPRDMLLVEA